MCTSVASAQKHSFMNSEDLELGICTTCNDIHACMLRSRLSTQPSNVLLKLTLLLVKNKRYKGNVIDVYKIPMFINGIRCKVDNSKAIYYLFRFKSESKQNNASYEKTSLFIIILLCLVCVDALPVTVDVH